MKSSVSELLAKGYRKALVSTKDGLCFNLNKEECLVKESDKDIMAISIYCGGFKMRKDQAIIDYV